MVGACFRLKSNDLCLCWCMRDSCVDFGQAAGRAAGRQAECAVTVLLTTQSVTGQSRSRCLCAARTLSRGVHTINPPCCCCCLLLLQGPFAVPVVLGGADLSYFTVVAMENEADPRCLLVALQCVEVCMCVVAHLRQALVRVLYLCPGIHCRLAESCIRPLAFVHHAHNPHLVKQHSPPSPPLPYPFPPSPLSPLWLCLSPLRSIPSLAPLSLGRQWGYCTAGQTWQSCHTCRTT